jgi:hypothetical protein
MDRPTLHRMSLHAVIVLAFFTGMGFVLTFVPGPASSGSGFSFAFFIAGLVWVAVSWLSGGFVSTYVAPVGGGRGTALYYANPERSFNLPSTAGPEVTADLREKMDDEPVGMAIAFVKAVAFFALAALFYVAPIAGFATLVGVWVLFATLFIRSRPVRPAPIRTGQAPDGSRK